MSDILERFYGISLKVSLGSCSLYLLIIFINLIWKDKLTRLFIRKDFDPLFRLIFAISLVAYCVNFLSSACAHLTLMNSNTRLNELSDKETEQLGQMIAAAIVCPVGIICSLLLMLYGHNGKTSNFEALNRMF